jgi:2-polyprenyl-3-methyl-5-hydroxy-6-metoxy-1,4-benzoquinol methylase
MRISNYKPKHIEDYFDEDPEKEWLRLVESPFEEIKLHIHEHYLRTHLTPGMHVLEIGAGPGRFTKTLHEIGCSIVVGDISSRQLQANKAKAGELGFAGSVEQWMKVDICDMAGLKSESFDALVAYGGPLSYVFESAHDALRECSRLLKPNGLLFASVMSLWGTLNRFLKAAMELPIENNREIIRTGNLIPETDPETRHFCHMFRADELRNLIETNGFRVIKLSASNSISTNHDETLATIRENPEWWSALLEMEVQASTSPGYVEAGTHILVIARKQCQ